MNWTATPRVLRTAGVIGTALTLCACIRIETTPAYVRLLNTSLDYQSLDLYVDDERTLTGVSLGSISEYREIVDGDSTFEFTKAGVTTALSTRDESLDSDSHTTLIAYGSTGKFSTLLLAEDRDRADAGEASVNVASTATDAGDLDVYLTQPADALDDVSPTFSTLAAGNLDPDAAVVLDSGTYRLRVVAAGSKTDVRLDVAEVSFASRSVTTLILSGTAGGVLVDAMVLPQQGEMTLLRNPQARIRAAIGLEDATAVTVLHDGAALVTGAPYTTVTGYRLADAGTHTLAAQVDGASVVQASVTLEAGANYTFLLYDRDSLPAYALLDDVQRRSGGDKARLRLVNAMGGLGAPLSVAVDYYPLVENVPLGQASAYSGTDSVTNGRIDVTNTTTAARLFYQTDVDLDADALYSIVMFGRPTSTTGVLRKDR